MNSTPTDHTTTEVENATRQTRERGKQIVEQTKEQAKEITSETQQQVKSNVTARKAQAVGQLGDVAEAFRVTGDQLRRKDKAAIASYTDKVADQVEQLTQYLDESDIDQLLEEGEDFARHQPELFLGGAFALGLFFGRFLKSSRTSSGGSQGRHYTANYGPSRQYRSPSEIGKTIHNKPGHITDTQPSQYRPQVSKPYPGERYES